MNMLLCRCLWPLASNHSRLLHQHSYNQFHSVGGGGVYTCDNVLHSRARFNFIHLRNFFAKLSDLGMSIATSVISIQSSADTCSVDTATNTPISTKQTVDDVQRVINRDTRRPIPNIAVRLVLQRLAAFL